MYQGKKMGVNIGKEEIKLYSYSTCFYIKRILRNLFFETTRYNKFIEQGFRVQGQCTKAIFTTKKWNMEGPMLTSNSFQNNVLNSTQSQS